jgi:hypothetical protein
MLRVEKIRTEPDTGMVTGAGYWTDWTVFNRQNGTSRFQNAKRNQWLILYCFKLFTKWRKFSRGQSSRDLTCSPSKRFRQVSSAVQCATR